MRARLALDVEPPQPAKALEYLGVLTPEALAKSLPGESAALRTELASAAALLQAQALFKQGNDAAGVAQLKKLREDFKGSEAVVASYLEEADHNAKLFKTVATKFAEGAAKAADAATMKGEALGALHGLPSVAFSAAASTAAP
mgnify:CR=1 FL=1